MSRIAMYCDISYHDLCIMMHIILRSPLQRQALEKIYVLDFRVNCPFANAASHHEGKIQNKNTRTCRKLHHISQHTNI